MENPDTRKPRRKKQVNQPHEILVGVPEKRVGFDLVFFWVFSKEKMRRKENNTPTAVRERCREKKTVGHVRK